MCLKKGCSGIYYLSTEVMDDGMLLYECQKCGNKTAADIVGEARAEAVAEKKMDEERERRAEGW